MGTGDPVLRGTLTASLAAFTVFSTIACGNKMTEPSSSAVVTFQVGSESFSVLLTSADQVRAAEAAQSGGRASIPNGRIVMGTDVNTGWGWHLENVAFAEVTIEVCDGRPSDVERLGTAFGGGRFCPWTARVVSITPR